MVPIEGRYWKKLLPKLNETMILWRAEVMKFLRGLVIAVALFVGRGCVARSAGR